MTFFKKEILFGPLCVLINRREVSRMQTETLLRRVQTGDADALDALVREYYPQILNYCRWHVPDAQQAQDAAQETFYKAVRWLDGCGGFAGQFRPFLYKIAKNVCADWHRASARDGPALESLPALVYAVPEGKGANAGPLWEDAVVLVPGGTVALREEAQ